jgi:surface protein
MFENTEFNHDISNWNINPECSIECMFDNCNIIDEYKPIPYKNLIVNEAFDFGSVGSRNKKPNIFPMILDILKTPYKNLTAEDKELLKIMKDSLPVYKVNTKDELISITSRAIKLFGNECDLNWIDVSSITNMKNLFYNTKFNGDISQWDVSNVKDMQGMFWYSLFNGDISKWDVSNVIDMSWMFEGSHFTGDISDWDVSNVR